MLTKRNRSTDRLSALLAKGESEHLECKRSAAAIDPISRSICAFANDLAGSGEPGAIIVGLEDDGSCADLKVTDKLLLKLASLKDNGNLQPLPSLNVSKHAIKNCEVAVIHVEPSRHPPVRFRGRVWVRGGPSNRQATPEDELRLAERSIAASRPFDMRPAPGTGLDDLDIVYACREYIPRAVAEEVLERNERSPDHQLRSLRLVTSGGATWGGLLAVGRDPLGRLPGAYVQFLRIDGEEITDPILDQQRLEGRLGEILHDADRLLRLNISSRTEIAGHLTEIRHPDYPLVALQQLVRNAVMHRSYEGTNSPVRIYWYSDRIEIMSPGPLYGRVNPENFARGQTDYRNPLVAESMCHLGFAQRFGFGIPQARKALAENGNPDPEFSFSSANVLVTLRPKQ